MGWPANLYYKMIPDAGKERSRPALDYVVGRWLQSFVPNTLVVLDNAQTAVAKTKARAQHHRTAGRGFAAHEQRDTDHALITDHGDLGRRTVLHLVHQRDYGRGRKINAVQCVPRLVECLAQRHVDGFKLRQPTPPLVGRQRREQAVQLGVVGKSHGTPGRLQHGLWTPLVRIGQNRAEKAWPNKTRRAAAKPQTNTRFSRLQTGPAPPCRPPPKRRSRSCPRPCPSGTNREASSSRWRDWSGRRRHTRKSRTAPP